MDTVVKLFSEDGYGFIKTTGGREIFFNPKSFLYNTFDHLEIGTNVLYQEEGGGKGTQAGNIEIVDHTA